MTVYVHCIYNTAAHKGATVTRYEKHRFLLEGVTVKTVLRIGDYLDEKPVILIFQNFMEIV